VHSRYSRAVSKDMNIGELNAWARKKGIAVMGTGDFTHPEWFAELQDQLEPAAEDGLFVMRDGRDDIERTRFILSVEVSCIYSKSGKVRKIHSLIIAPSFEAVKMINAQLGRIGNLHSDGRPILGLDAKELARIVFDASDECLFIPAHAWTPWFSVFGSMSGFDSLGDCFEEYTSRIYAIETGLSSDPAMNWRVSALDNVALVSNSDSHSGRKIGREANIFSGEVGYSAIHEAIRFAAPLRAAERGMKKTILEQTIEFFPEEGKYHYDGHRDCGVSWPPEKTKEYGGLCSVCGKRVTVGVMSRVAALADREMKTGPLGAPGFISLVPLEETIASSLGVGVVTKTVQREYEKLLSAFGTEFSILLDVPQGEIETVALPLVSEGIRRMRAGQLRVVPGYDGEFGRVEIFTDEERKSISASADIVPQERLF